jgi:uncharacterized membrane protein YccC
MGARIVVVLASAVAGAVVVVGCLLAGLFEIQGFGTPRDAEPRTGRLVGFALGIAAGVAIPLALWRILLPERAPGTGVVVGIAALVLVIAVLGLAVGNSG